MALVRSSLPSLYLFLSCSCLARLDLLRYSGPSHFIYFLLTLTIYIRLLYKMFWLDPFILFTFIVNYISPLLIFSISFRFLSVTWWICIRHFIFSLVKVARFPCFLPIGPAVPYVFFTFVMVYGINSIWFTESTGFSF